MLRTESPQVAFAARDVAVELVDESQRGDQVGVPWFGELERLELGAAHDPKRSDARRG